MKRYRILWFIVFVLVIAMIATSLETSYSQQNQKQSSENISATPTNKITPKQRDWTEWLQQRAEYESQFPVVDYETPEPDNPAERNKRQIKSKQFDNSKLHVIKNPVQETSEARLFDAIPLPNAVPVNESEIIVVGEMLNAQAYLSNDKTGVYSEFTVRVDEVLKNSNADKVAKDSLIIVDRPGGAVRYPNGRKIIYSVSQMSLPRTGRQYVLFLANHEQSPNYNILTGYELKGGKVVPLDKASRFENFNGLAETDFITTIREAIAQSQQRTNKQ